MGFIKTFGIRTVSIRISDPSKHENVSLFHRPVLTLSSLYLPNPIIRSVVDEFPTLIFLICKHFQVDPYPPVKMLWIRNADFNTAVDKC